MKPKELRIGNYLQPKHRTLEFPHDMIEVLTITQKGCDIRNYTNFIKKGYSFGKYDTIEPIPLTEDWLLKFGLRRNKEAEKSDYQRWEQCEGHNIGLFYFSFFINSFNRPVFRLVFERNGCYSPNLKGVGHVHQLQNLYFALTGEELKTK